MWNVFWETGDKMLQSAAGFDRQHWLVVFLVVVIVGWYCLRGYGSRGGY